MPMIKIIALFVSDDGLNNQFQLTHTNYNNDLLESLN